MADQIDPQQALQALMRADTRDTTAMMTILDHLQHQQNMHSELQDGDGDLGQLNVQALSPRGDIFNLTGDDYRHDNSSSQFDAPAGVQSQPSAQSHHHQQQQNITHHHQDYQDLSHPQAHLNQTNNARSMHDSKPVSSQSQPHSHPHVSLDGNNHNHNHNHNPTSPRLSGISVSPALLNLADSVQPILVPRLTDDIDDPELGPTDRGEMGGKRKKQPHERAGWREMDEQGLLKKRATGGRKKQTIEEFVGFVPHEPMLPAGAGSGSGMQDDHGHGHGHVHGMHMHGQEHEHAEMGNGHDHQMHSHVHGHHAHAHDEDPDSLANVLGEGSGSYGQVQEQDPRGRAGSGSQERSNLSTAEQKRHAKTEQNRRAQQIYRRRREERIKQLENDAHALNKARNSVVEAKHHMQNMAFEQEAAQVEITALRAALRAVANQGASILTATGTLPLMENGEPMQIGRTGKEALESAFERLTRQSREAVKARKG